MKIWGAKIAEMIMMDIVDGMSKEDAIVNGLIVEMAIPWNSDASVLEIANAMKNVDSPEEHVWKLFDGVLYMDGNSVKRVGSKDCRPCFDDEADYWEGRCLSMGEPVD